MEDNIRVNAIAPGLIKTKFSSVLWDKNEEKSAKYMKVNRLGVPEDIANVAHFLLSNQSSYMTGECLAVVGKPLSRLWFVMWFINCSFNKIKIISKNVLHLIWRPNENKEENEKTAFFSKRIGG